MAQSVGHALANTFCTNDVEVLIEVLRPGDQAVFYGNPFHPRHHGIVVSVDQDHRKVTLVHKTFKNGVVEEEVDFRTPVYKVIHDDRLCYAPNEVVSRARSELAINRKYKPKYYLIGNNCKHFAYWCKLR